MTISINWLRPVQVITGVIPWTSGTWKVALLDDTWVANEFDDQNWTDLSAFEVSVAGITAGGATLSSRTSEEISVTSLQLYTDDVVFSPSATLDTNGAAIYETTSDKVIATIDFGETYSVPSGQTLTLDFPNVSTAPVVTMVDPDATDETKRLYAAIEGLKIRTTKRVMSGIMFGSPTSTTDGAGVRTAVFNTSGKYPLIHGYEIANGAFSGAQLPALSQSKLATLKAQIITDAGLGNIPMLATHVRNPDPAARTISATSPSNYDYDVANPCNFTNLTTPGHQTHTNWMAFLSGVGDFINSLVDSSNRKIPVIFRPFHEMTGGDFWWSVWNPSVLNNPDKFRLAWQQMVTYLRDTKNCHNIIWMYHTHSHDPKGYNNLSSSSFDTSDLPGGSGSTKISGWEALYPGDAYVDIVSCSVYAVTWPNTSSSGAIVNRVVQLHERVAPGKPFMTGEIGPTGWPPNTTTWDMNELITANSTQYVEGGQYNTTGLKPFNVGWMHWSGSWAVNKQTNYIVAFQDAMTCNRGDLVF